jgi:hypothetical protein
MERAGSFTAISGSGIMGAGVIAVVAGVVAAGQSTTARWVLVWIVAAAAALSFATLLTARKARSLGMPLTVGPGRKAVLAFSPAILAGAILTWALIDLGRQNLLAGLWLLLFGAGVAAGGALSVRIVPVLGFCFMGLGVAALLAPGHLANWFMIGGFGGLHLAFGLAISRRYGG